LDKLSKIDGLKPIRPRGAMYMMVKLLNLDNPSEQNRQKTV